MKAAFCLGSGKFDVREVAVPVIGSDEALVQVKGAGICGSDKWDLGRAELPSRIAGHEFSGIVEAVGAKVRGIAPGTAVVVEPAVGCTDCPGCRGGNYTECQKSRAIGYGLPGAFAEYVAVPARNLFPMPPDLGFAEASFAEPTAVAMHATGLAEIAGRVCAVFGSGTIGLLVAQALKARGASEVWVVDISAEHLRVAESLGSLRTINSAEDPELTALQGGVVDVAIEAVGHFDSVLQNAVKALRRYGTLVLLGSRHPSGIATGTIVNRSLTIRGSNGRTLVEFQEGLRLLEAGKIQVKPLISATYTLTEMDAAFARARGAMKVIIAP